MITKKCKYCYKEFETNNLRKEYCCKQHKNIFCKHNKKQPYFEGMKKVCITCKQEFLVDKNYQYRLECPICRIKRQKERQKRADKKYYQSEKGKQNTKRKYLTCTKRIVTEWREKNPDKIKKIQAKHRKSEKRKKYIKNYFSVARHKIRQRMSNLIYQSVKGKKLGKCWEHLVGYTVEKLMKHLESKFQTGMTWENYGGWHIDHLVPESWFHYESVYDEEFKKCWALSNLQPKWAKENLQKNNHYIG